jgi:hypothetical protein
MDQGDSVPCRPVRILGYALFLANHETARRSR